MATFFKKDFKTLKKGKTKRKKKRCSIVKQEYIYFGIVNFFCSTKKNNSVVITILLQKMYNNRFPQSKNIPSKIKIVVHVY